MVTEEEVNTLLQRIVQNPFEDISELSKEPIPEPIWSKENEGDKEFSKKLLKALKLKYHKNPQRAKAYQKDIFAFYLWMKGRHPTLQEISEGMNWSLQKCRAVLKIAREFGVVRKYSRNSEEYQLAYRWDLTQEFKEKRRYCFVSPSEEYEHSVDFFDITDWLGNDYSEFNQEYVMGVAESEIEEHSEKYTWWFENRDRVRGITRDINGNPIDENTPDKYLPRGYVRK